MTTTMEATISRAYSEDMQDVRCVAARLDEINRAITKAKGRIKHLQMSAERANSTLTPVRYGRGFEHSSVEYSVLECEAERWGISELQKEREELLEILTPLIMRLPAGLYRIVAEKRYIEGAPCGIISKQLSYSRCHIYRVLEAVTDMMCGIAKR